MQQQDEKFLIQFGKHIKKLREEKSSSLNSLIFTKGGVSTATLSRIENGLVDSKLLSLAKIAAAFDMPLYELFKEFHFDYDLTKLDSE